MSSTDTLADRIRAGDPAADLELIVALGARWERLRQKYPEEREFDESLDWNERAAGWVALATGLAIIGLMEEHYGKERLGAMRAELKREGRANDHENNTDRGGARRGARRAARR